MLTLIYNLITSIVTNIGTLLTRTASLIENRTSSISCGTGTTSSTLNTFTTVLNISSACVVTGMVFNLSTPTPGLYTFRITIDGTVYVTNSIGGSSSSVNPFTIPTILKCNTGFKVEIESTVSAASFGYIISYAV